MKEIKDYLHLYLGCEVYDSNPKQEKFRRYTLTGKELGYYENHLHTIKPILRKLSDMSEEEAKDFSLSCLNSPHAPEHFDTIEKDELQIEFVKNDGGLMLDNDVDLYFNVSCRCLDGYIAIMKDGRIGMANEQDVPTREMQPVDDIYGKVRWLLSNHFDLFGLIESGLAIEKTKFHNRHDT